MLLDDYRVWALAYAARKLTLGAQVGIVARGAVLCPRLPRGQQRPDLALERGYEGQGNSPNPG